MPEIGESLSHYRILSRIGQGGMGEVFLARDTVLERDVAIKFLPQDMRGDPLARRRFLREARSAATLAHPHICVVHETSEAAGTPFIVMEYIDGPSLQARLALGPLPLGEALRLAAEIADALEAAHARHLVHRDLKPANVMLTGTGHAKVTDFGLARRWLVTDEATTGEVQTVTQLTQPGTTLGTLAYMSPEQLQGQPLDHRSDIFSFGAMLYEMITGAHPFKREEGMETAAAILGEEPVPLAQRVPGIPRRLVDLISRMLAKAPARRPRAMREIREALKGVLLEVEPPPGVAGFVDLKKLWRLLRQPRVAVPVAAAVLALVVLGAWFVRHQAQVRWAREEALPEIDRLLGENDVWRNLVPPYRLAERAEAVIPGDARLNELFARCSVKITITTEPPGAQVFMKEYAAPDGEWGFLGVTPIEQIRVPIGIFRWRFEKEGYDTVLAAASTWNSPPQENAEDGAATVVPCDLARVLDKTGSMPPGMVRVTGEETPVGTLGDFYIDRYEVTNRQYKAFIDNGGYQKRDYWKHQFIQDGKALTWKEATAAFVDQTGQLGPSTWQAGVYPEGQAEYPVSGISWYEAVAYAESVGRTLPTDHHWSVARGAHAPMSWLSPVGGSAVVAAVSNFQGKGPVRVGSLPSLTAHGASDMPGNVREWCWNETRHGRLVNGGAWDDDPYSFRGRAQAPPMDRSARNGFRCAVYPYPEKLPPAAFGAVELGAGEDFSKERPVPDSVFQVYRNRFSYDKTDLKARVESRQNSPGGWLREKITFDAAYGGERITAYLFLPRNASGPLQTVIYFPGLASLIHKSSEDLETYYEFPTFLSFVVKSGRAVLFPVYKGTFERGDPALARISDGADSHLYTEFLIKLVKDLRRCVDYLETRPDTIDSRSLAYYGMSWGGNLGAIIPAVEERLKASVLVRGRLTPLGRPEARPIHYVTRVRTPTLLVAGKYDVDFDTGVKPLFDLLGTPAEHKRLFSSDTDGIPPMNEFIKEALAWLDRYLGPVKR